MGHHCPHCGVNLLERFGLTLEISDKAEVEDLESELDELELVDDEGSE